MTKEQIIVGLNKMLDNTIKANECGLSNNDFKDDIELLKTVLSMLKEKDAEIEKKDKQIDLMAEEINETDRGYIDYCQFKMVCDRNCKECIKQYFERKSEE